MNKSITKYYLAPILTLVSIVVLVLIGMNEGSYQRKRSRCLRELNSVLSCVHSSMDFDTFDALLKKRIESLTDFLIKEAKEQGSSFDEDDQSVQLFEHMRRIHSLIGGRAWIESCQRQALFRLHEVLADTKDRDSEI